MNKIINILEKIQSSVQVGGGGTIFFSYSADQISDSVFLYNMRAQLSSSFARVYKCHSTFRRPQVLIDL